MKTNKNNLLSQRQIIEKKLKPWVKLRDEKIPQSGWIKAVRGALGLNTRQLADLLNVDHSTILRLEKRETNGKVTLEILAKVAQAMNCRLVYAVVPDKPYSSLESILDERARGVAKEIVEGVEHTMRLEQQGVDAEDSQQHTERLAQSLKMKFDSRLWNKKPRKRGK